VGLLQRGFYSMLVGRAGRDGRFIADQIAARHRAEAEAPVTRRGVRTMSTPYGARQAGVGDRRTGAGRNGFARHALTTAICSSVTPLAVSHGL
jgi:hypothetical protein